MPVENDQSELLRAASLLAKYKPIIFCSISLVAVGMLMVVFGLVVMLLDHVEMGPPHFDTQYERYQGSSLAHVVGPMFIIFGSFIILGNLILLGFASRAYYLNNEVISKNKRFVCKDKPMAKKRYPEYI